MWEEGGGSQYLWVELVHTQSGLRCAWAARLCDWWSMLQLSPLPLLKKEVQLEHQTQTAQDSEVSTRPKTAQTPSTFTEPDSLFACSSLVVRSAFSSAHWGRRSEDGEAGAWHLCCGSRDANPTLPEQDEPVCVIRSTGCLFSLHELLRWGGWR